VVALGEGQAEAATAGDDEVHDRPGDRLGLDLAREAADDRRPSPSSTGRWRTSRAPRRRSSVSRSGSSNPVSRAASIAASISTLGLFFDPRRGRLCELPRSALEPTPSSLLQRGQDATRASRRPDTSPQRQGSAQGHKGRGRMTLSLTALHPLVRRLPSAFAGATPKATISSSSGNIRPARCCGSSPDRKSARSRRNPYGIPLSGALDRSSSCDCPSGETRPQPVGQPPQPPNLMPRQDADSHDATAATFQRMHVLAPERSSAPPVDADAP
jgi:hypothetical protein